MCPPEQLQIQIETDMKVLRWKAEMKTLKSNLLKRAEFLKRFIHSFLVPH